jgi:putative glutamine amidotransferase
MRHMRYSTHTMARMGIVIGVLALLSTSSLSCRPCPSQTAETIPPTTPEAPIQAVSLGPPLIGISGYVIPPEDEGGEGLGYYRVTRTYRDAVIRAGGHPVHLVRVPDDQVAQLLSHLDGVILAGGPDIDPALFGEEQHPTVELLPRERQDFDIAIARAAAESGLPILGICLGSQEINVALGGDMIQDIPSEVESDVNHRTTGIERSRVGVHEITFEEGSRLAGFYEQSTISVNSLHHQASDDMAEGLVVEARAPDGVVEGYSMPDHPFLVGVQFHPEIQNDPPGLHDRLFQAFLEAAAAHRDRRHASGVESASESAASGR